MLQYFSTKGCTFKNGTLILPFEMLEGKRPEQTVIMVSHKTGKGITFVVDEEDMMNNEFYDGMLVTYKPKFDTDACVVKKLVIQTGM